MDRFERVSALDNEIHAMLVDRLLSQQQIPHVIHSNHDSAYDGVFQMVAGWGYLEAPERCHEQVRAVLAEVMARVESANTWEMRDT